MGLFSGLSDIFGGGGQGVGSSSGVTGFSGGGAFNNSDETRNLNQDQTTSNVDNRVGEDYSVFGGNVTVNPGDITGSLSVSTTDQGAILAGKDIALESIGALMNAVNSTKSVASDSISQAYGLANSARQSETSGAINNFLKYGSIVLVCGFAAYAIVKYGK